MGVKTNRTGWKRMIVPITCLGLMFSGCADGQDAGSVGVPDPAAAGEAAFTRNEKGIPDLQGEDFQIWFALTANQAKFTANLSEFTVIQELEKKLNCKLQFSHPPVGQEKDNFSIMLAGGEWPDMIFSSGIGNYPGGMGAALADGVMFDVTPYINEIHTPNFIKAAMNDETTKKWFMDDDSRVVKLGSKVTGSEEADTAFFGPLVRKDYLEATGMEIPCTVEEWRQMLSKMKENGVEYPLALPGSGWKIDRSCSFIASAYGFAMDYYVKEDGKTVGYGFGEPAYKDYLATMNQWYSEGLINPDYPTQTMEDCGALLASGKSAASIVHLMDYTTKYFVTNETPNPDQAMLPAQFPVLSEGDALSRFRPSSRGVADHKTITAKAKNPMACIYLLDALYIDEINHMLSYGTEGVTYDVIGGMAITRPLTEDTPKDIQLQGFPGQWHTTEDDSLDAILLKYNAGCDEAAIRLWGACATSGSLPASFMAFTTEESAVKGKYQTEIDTYVDEMTMKFITGVEPLSSFEEYLGQLKAMHLDELIAVNQASFDRYNAR